MKKNSSLQKQKTKKYKPEILQAYKKAVEVRLKAHAPYSKFLVGACFKVKNSEEYISGCNVENASFGATVCAERVAVWKWVSGRKKTEALEFLVLVTDTENPVATPCGMCLQVLSEFIPAKFPIYISNLKGIQKEVQFKDLLPSTFELK
ncbi:MAG: cytidine deaminase [Bdellovibrionaceae bacterium]|nr:cytidine deaminase [Pseudobdellovibrionaceae bacterium]